MKQLFEISNYMNCISCILSCCAAIYYIAYYIIAILLQVIRINPIIYMNNLFIRSENNETRNKQSETKLLRIFF